jgi:hypothetical protein
LERANTSVHKRCEKEKYNENKELFFCFLATSDFILFHARNNNKNVHRAYFLTSGGGGGGVPGPHNCIIDIGKQEVPN